MAGKIGGGSGGLGLMIFQTGKLPQASVTCNCPHKQFPCLKTGNCILAVYKLWKQNNINTSHFCIFQLRLSKCLTNLDRLCPSSLTSQSPSLYPSVKWAQYHNCAIALCIMKTNTQLYVQGPLWLTPKGILFSSSVIMVCVCSRKDLHSIPSFVRLFSGYNVQA